MDKNIITQREAMKLLRDMGMVGISHAQIKEAADTGKFKTWQPGKRKFYLRDSVIAWAQAFRR